MSEAIPAALRREVAARANHICEYCLCPSAYALHTFECEHIVARSLDGRTSLENLAWSCGGCNRFKAVRFRAVDPESGIPVQLYNPRIDAWQSNFAWSHDYLDLIALNASARATIHALRLNRPGVRNIRQLLMMVDKHPPTW